MMKCGEQTALDKGSTRCPAALAKYQPQALDETAIAMVETNLVQAAARLGGKAASRALGCFLLDKYFATSNTAIAITTSRLTRRAGRRRPLPTAPSAPSSDRPALKR